MIDLMKYEVVMSPFSFGNLPHGYFVCILPIDAFKVRVTNLLRVLGL